MLNFENMISVRALAKRYGLSRTWVYHSIRERRVPHVRIGKRILVDPVEFERRVVRSFYYGDGD